jgi:hypothetical protein
MTTRRLVAVLAIAFFALPLAVRATGVTARPFENHALAPTPSLKAGWDVFDQTTRFFVDHMPLREQAVRAYSWTAQHVLTTRRAGAASCSPTNRPPRRSPRTTPRRQRRPSPPPARRPTLA